MSAIHGKNTYVEIDDATGTPVPLSSFLKSAAYAKSIDTAESSTFGQSAKTYVLGMNDATIDISGNFDAAFNTHMNGVIAALDDGTLASATVTVGPAGNATGKPRVSAECLVKSYQWTAGIGDVVGASVSFQRTGPSTDGVFA
jgi:hypothetical protein